MDRRLFLKTAACLSAAAAPVAITATSEPSLVELWAKLETAAKRHVPVGFKFAGVYAIGDKPMLTAENSAGEKLQCWPHRSNDWVS